MHLVARVKERFQDVLQSGEENSDPFYLAAAFLDPQTALCSILRGKEAKAKASIKKLVMFYINNLINLENATFLTLCCLFNVSFF